LRFNGKLHTWNEQRGFGFIRPLDGGQDVFVHVSALPAVRPTPNDVLTFEISAGRDGKKRAIDVRLQQVEAAGLAADRERSGAREQRTYDEGHRRRRGGARRGGARSVLKAVIVSALVGALGWQASLHYPQRVAQPVSQAEPVARDLPPSARCDGRTMCSQMTSCEEAKFFLKNCPGTQMDGDGDGVPCETQWCKPGW